MEFCVGGIPQNNQAVAWVNKKQVDMYNHAY